jgi:uncharacterized membrane protein/uncharacterized membrane protein YeaQ/YmgE (transglycosylase-associated protein family)
MLQALTWIATGLLVGWLVRTAMKSRRDLGVVGDLVTGTLGAVVGGWIVRTLNIVTPNNLLGHFVVSIFGAAALLAVMRAVRGAVDSGLLTSAPQTLAVELEEQIRRLSAVERRILSRVLGAKPQDPNIAFDQQLTFGQRVADRVASFGGSWAFIGLFLSFMFAWMSINNDQHPFDPYPYILLNLMLSCVAALQAPVIMMSQNRQSTRDRIEARNDYEVNLRAEMQIVALHAKLDSARDQEWARLAELLVSQNERLGRIEQQLSTLPRHPL